MFSVHRFHSWQRTRVCLSLMLLLAVTTARDAHAQASEASALSLLPVAVVSVASVSIFTAGAKLTVVAVEASAQGAMWVLERASDGARATLKVAGNSAIGVGTAVMVSATTAGWVLSAGGQAIACVADEIGASLLYNERVTR